MSFAHTLTSCSHRLTGWNAVKSRVEQLGLQLSDAEVSLKKISLSVLLIDDSPLRSRMPLPRSKSSQMSEPNLWMM